jgi:hypothetical protein
LREFVLTAPQLYCLEHGIQPDGYLTEERKAKDDDHGFSTFFSETGTPLQLSRHQHQR